MLIVRSLLLLYATALLFGCAGGVPSAIRDAKGTSVTVSAVQQTGHRFIGTGVRWVGTILSVRNLKDLTEIEILARPTDADGEPDLQREGQGRFVAMISGFLDPAEFPTDRLLTVVGDLDRIETRPVGDYPYRYPIVAVRHRYLWPESASDAYRYPYGYPGPWYRPWYGPGPWWGPGYYW